MDKKHNVDDILAEIKARKARERAAAPGGRPSAQEPREAAPPVGSSARAQPKPEPEPVQGEQPPRTAGPDDGRLHFMPVDEGDTTVSFDALKPEKQAQKPAATRRDAEGDDGFRFEMPPVEKVGRNPLDFDGHVRPITDKAKIRRERATRAPEPAEEHKPPQVINFAKFRPPTQELEAVRPRRDPEHAVTKEHERVLPKPDFGRSAEFQMEDIRKIDFGAVADEYEDDYDDGEAFGEVSGTVPLDAGEYNSVTDRGAVARDIARVKTWLVLRALFTGLLTAGLFYFTLAGKYADLPLPNPLLEDGILLVRPFMVTVAVLSVLVALVCSSAVGGGLISLFRMRANSDTLPALALLAAIGQSVAGVIRPETVAPESLSLFASVASLSMLFNAFGKMMMLSRIQANFRIISSDRPKRAVLAVQSDAFCRGLVPAPARRRPTVAYSAKAGFLTDFLALSYSDKYDVGVHRGVAPACLLAALFVAAVSYIITQDAAAAITALSAILCVAATFSSTFIENIPLGKLTRRLAPVGGMVSGNKAVEDFCDTRAVILREIDLFPAGHVKLHGIKAYRHGRIDEAILDAASVLCITDSSLSPLFLEMIGGNTKLLKKAENIVCESSMGISAWVNSRRILIGNRALMEGHGIQIPQGDYEQKYAEHGAESIYLSNSGEVSAQFVFSYHLDEALAAGLDELAARGRLLVVHTMNPHVTPHKLWELYGYPEELIEVMPGAMHPDFAEMSAPRDTAVAEIAYTGGASMMVRAILSCMNARASILSATVIQLMQIAVGYGMVMFIAIMGAIGVLNILQLTLYQLFWFLVVFLVQQLRGS